TVRELHGHFIRTNRHKNPNAMSQVIESYARSPPSIDKARFAFSEIEAPTLALCNHMIRGLSRSDTPADALHVFDKMCVTGLRIDNITLIFITKACGRVTDVSFGRRVHTRVLKLGFGSYLYVCNALIHMYGCCADFRSSRRIFDEMDEKDLVSWNSMICAYSHCERYEDVLAVFQMMRAAENTKPDAVTMVKVIFACSFLGESELIDRFVEYIDDNSIEMDVYLGNTLIDVFGNRGRLEMARGFFDRITEKNSVSWNAMLIAYAKSGDFVRARKVFDEMPCRDVVSWTSMITGFVQANRPDDAIAVFLEMTTGSSEVGPDRVTLTAVLSACARTGRLDVGKTVHDTVRRTIANPDVYVLNALIDMYCKCGSVGEAMAVFRGTEAKKDPVTWTCIISGLAVNGDPENAFRLFSRMSLLGVKPAHGTFVAVILACVHSGDVDRGLAFFRSMEKDHGLVPEMKHYGAVVDLMCRAGYLERAHDFIAGMPVDPDPALWTMLLGGCRLHGDLVLSGIAMEKLRGSEESKRVSGYVLSSNSYASAGKWDDATRMREEFREFEIKPSGWSCLQ
ncbi:hypothetical protein M569_03376, partial [Genlisea aurea]